MTLEQLGERAQAIFWSTVIGSTLLGGLAAGVLARRFLPHHP